MKEALSLRTGGYVRASVCDYSTHKELLLVCPECAEPVHFKQRLIPRETPYLAHYQEIHRSVCSMRVPGASLVRASAAVKNLKHGQCVDRFQKQFCSEIRTELGASWSDFEGCLWGTRDVVPDERLLTTLRRELLNTAPCRALFPRISRSNWRVVVEAVADVHRFLATRYGRAPLIFLHKAACFLAFALDARARRAACSQLVLAEGRSYIFAADEDRVAKAELRPIFAWQFDRLSRLRVAITATLVVFLVARWQAPQSTPHLFCEVTTVA